MRLAMHLVMCLVMRLFMRRRLLRDCPVWELRAIRTGAHATCGAQNVRCPSRRRKSGSVLSSLLYRHWTMGRHCGCPALPWPLKLLLMLRL